MANNKVQLADGTVLIDLTGDNIQPENVEEGVTFHDASGTQRSGTLQRGAQVASGKVVLPGSGTSFTITPGFKVKKLCIGTSVRNGSGLYVNGTIDTTTEGGIKEVSSTEAKTTVTFTSYLHRDKVNIWWMAST